MPDEKITTMHPDRKKQGITVSKAKYDLIRRAILTTLEEKGEVGSRELSDLLREQMQESFAGSVGWFVTTVSLDLQARGEIERVPRSKPDRLRIKRPKFRGLGLRKSGHTTTSPH